MIRKGQIVEIPASAAVYSRELPVFHSKRDELIWKSGKKQYSLFDGFLVGEHQGLENFRLGQRKGISVGGKKEPLYVIGMDEKENRLFVGAGEAHPGLWEEVVSLGDAEWHTGLSFSGEELEKGVDVEIVTQSGGHNIPAKLYGFEGSFFLEFKNKMPLTAVGATFGLIYQDKMIMNITKN